MADQWDKMCCHDINNIRNLLRIADINEGCSVLDVGCGTGVLEKYILEFSPKRVKAIDMSSQMIDIARDKYEDKNVDFECIDFFSMDEKKGLFDRIVIYNSFPHFEDYESVIDKCHYLLKPMGRVLVAHDCSREEVNNLHKDIELKPVNDLPPAKSLISIFSPVFLVDSAVDDDNIYCVSGVKIGRAHV